MLKQRAPRRTTLADDDWELIETFLAGVVAVSVERLATRPEPAAVGDDSLNRS